MIRLVRTARARVPEAAAELALELTQHVRKNHSQAAIEVFIDRFANGGRNISWHIDFKNLGDYERWQAALAKDDKYRKYIEKAKADNLFAEDTMSDTINHSVDEALAKVAIH